MECGATCLRMVAATMERSIPQNTCAVYVL